MGEDPEVSDQVVATDRGGRCATVAYAVAILGFGLDFRPLQNDEGVTLMVASKLSVSDVLHTAIDVRHGPPLHYLLVHASLRLARQHPRACDCRRPCSGILAVAISYGTGRELLGRSGGAIVSVVVASSPITIHLGQFARGYTAMMAAAFASLWLLLILVRTRHLRWVVPYVLCALLLVAAHPFGLFALASEMVLLVVLGLGPKLRHPKRWRAGVAAYVCGRGCRGCAPASSSMVLLRQVYAPLQNKYGVGQGLGGRSTWDRVGFGTGWAITPPGLRMKRRCRDRAGRGRHRGVRRAVGDQPPGRAGGRASGSACRRAC